MRWRLLEAPGVSAAMCSLDPRLRATARVDRQTALVIEGFPRSANTYAVVSFRYANAGATVVSHSHVFRTVRRAARHDVPSIVLARDPRDALASAMQFDGSARPMAALRHYHAFYRRALAHRDLYVLALFDEAVTDFGAVIARCNTSFGTTFLRYVPTREAELTVYSTMDRWTAAKWTGPDAIARFTRPTPERRSATEVLAGLSSSDRLELDRAVELYGEVVATREADCVTPGGS